MSNRTTGTEEHPRKPQSGERMQTTAQAVGEGQKANKPRRGERNTSRLRRHPGKSPCTRPARGRLVSGHDFQLWRVARDSSPRSIFCATETAEPSVPKRKEKRNLGGPPRFSRLCQPDIFIHHGPDKAATSGDPSMRNSKDNAATLSRADLRIASNKGRAIKISNSIEQETCKRGRTIWPFEAVENRFSP